MEVPGVTGPYVLGGRPGRAGRPGRLTSGSGAAPRHAAGSPVVGGSCQHPPARRIPRAIKADTSCLFFGRTGTRCPGIETQGLRLPRLVSQPVHPDLRAPTSKTGGRGWPGLRRGFPCRCGVGGTCRVDRAWRSGVPQGESGCSDRKQLRMAARRRTRVPPTAPPLSPLVLPPRAAAPVRLRLPRLCPGAAAFPAPAHHRPSHRMFPPPLGFH